MGCRLAFASASMAFSTRSSQVSGFPATMLYLGLDRGLETFTEVLDENGLGWGPVSVKLLGGWIGGALNERLNQVLPPLVQEVSRDSAPDDVHESLRPTKTLLSETIKIVLRQRSHFLSSPPTKG